MPEKTVVLVNPNLMRPPIGPIGLDYVADGLMQAGYEPVMCDLTFAEDWRQTLNDALADTSPLAVGVSVRNLDDCYFASQDFILDSTMDIIRHIQGQTEAPVVLGGIGFSVAPGQTLAYTGADYGIIGDGASTFPLLLEAMAGKRDLLDVPGAVFRADGQMVVGAPAQQDTSAPLPRTRRHIDNVRYYREGGQAGIETKRGCDRACIYCPEPTALGRRIRLRAPQDVVREFEALLEQGVDVVHLCDSEFNLPAEHAHAVCAELVRSGVAEHVKWYAYASPAPFDEELAQAMAAAGCVGIDFGVDHTEEAMLRRLGRMYSSEDVERTACACRATGLVFMFDMLFGGPGETKESISRAIDAMRALDADRVGLSCGVRIFPHTPLARLVRSQGPLKGNPHLHGNIEDNEQLLRPIFYVDAGIGEDIFDCVSALVKGDRRFLHANPNELDGNYNYNDNSVLSQAIQAGARGAYWDILRRLDGDGQSN